MEEDDCAICHCQIVDKVFMTCSAKHPFCFGCILKTIEVNNTLKNCPSCRGGDKYILVEKYNEQNGSDFYTLAHFKKCIPIIQIISKEDITPNSCLISENALLIYIKNKIQLDIIHKIMPNSDYDLNNIIPIFKWTIKSPQQSFDDSEFMSSINSINNTLSSLPGLSNIISTFPHPPGMLSQTPSRGWRG